MRDSDRLDGLVARLRCHIAAMAPHHRDREGGKLVQESYDAILELRAALAGFIPQHRASCCERVAGAFRPTEKACRCDARIKASRELAGRYDLPMSEEEIESMGGREPCP